MKIPLETSKDTKEFNPGLDDTPIAVNNTSAAASGVGIGNIKNDRISVQMQINHQGEVNRVRYMPQQHKFIATKTVTGEVHLFDYFKHGGQPLTDEVKPDLRLLGHSREGYGLDWNPC